MGENHLDLLLHSLPSKKQLKDKNKLAVMNKDETIIRNQVAYSIALTPRVQA